MKRDLSLDVEPLSAADLAHLNAAERKIGLSRKRVDWKEEEKNPEKKI